MKQKPYGTLAFGGAAALLALAASSVHAGGYHRYHQGVEYDEFNGGAWRLDGATANCRGGCDAA